MPQVPQRGDNATAAPSRRDQNHYRDADDNASEPSCGATRSADHHVLIVDARDRLDNGVRRDPAPPAVAESRHDSDASQADRHDEIGLIHTNTRTPDDHESVYINDLQ